MGALRQERVGGGRTNASKQLPDQASSGGSSGRPPSGRPPSGLGSRPSTAGSRRPTPLASSLRPQESVPHDRPTSAPASRPSTAGSNRPPVHPWQEEGSGDVQHFARRSLPGFDHVPRSSRASRPSTAGSARDRARIRDTRRDELFSGSPAGSGHQADHGGSSQASSRPGTASSLESMASMGRPTSAPMARAKQDERPGTGASVNSESSEACEERLLQFQKYFQAKNGAKFSQLRDAFRDVDQDKNGALGPDEIAMAMGNLGIPVDKRLVDRLMSRCQDPTQMTMVEFKDLLWIDDSMETYIDDRKNRRAGTSGTTGYKYLWTRIRPTVDSKFVGCLNDTFEADKKDSGTTRLRLDQNFSSVSYDILSFGDKIYNPPPDKVTVPVKQRPRFFDPPASAGRRVAYDRGDTPYNITSLESPRIPSDETITQATKTSDAPVRLSTFSRVHHGELPTQMGHMLSKTVV
jgi:hypothetical protein